MVKNEACSGLFVIIPGAHSRTGLSYVRVISERNRSADVCRSAARQVYTYHSPSPPTLHGVGPISSAFSDE